MSPMRSTRLCRWSEWRYISLFSIEVPIVTYDSSEDNRKREVWVSVSFVNNFICNIIQKAWLTFNKKCSKLYCFISDYAAVSEWQNEAVWVVVAKSLALVCTKDQNRFCFSIWNQNKFFFKNPQMKKEPKKKKSPKTNKKKWTTTKK